MNNDERDKKMYAIHAAVIAIQTELEGFRGIIASHDKLLQGNGRPGLVMRVARLEWFKMLACSVGGATFVMLFSGLVAWGFGKF